MSKIDRALKIAQACDYKSINDLDASIESLVKLRNLVQEAVDHYSDVEMLNNDLQPWYSNAREHYESRLGLIIKTLISLTKKREIFIGDK